MTELITSLEQAGEGSREMLVDLNAAPFTREFFDALNGYATGGSGRCLETLAIWNAKLAPPPPSVSTDNGSRPQEAVPTEQAERAVVGDYPDADGTDAAHPAWWRGHEHTAAVFCQKVNELLDGKDDGKGVANPPWETTRRRLLAVRAATVDLIEADAELARAVNFCEPTGRLTELMLAEGQSRTARNAALACLAASQPADGCSSNERAGQ